MEKILSKIFPGLRPEGGWTISGTSPPLVVDRANASSTGGGVSKIAEMRHRQGGGLSTTSPVFLMQNERT